MTSRWLQAGTSFLIALIVASCAPPRRESHYQSAPADSLQDGRSPVMTNNGKPLSVTPTGLTFAFDPDFPEPFKDACMRAAGTWNEGIGSKFLRFSGGTYSFNAAEDGHSVISLQKDANNDFAKVQSKDTPLPKELAALEKPPEPAALTRVVFAGQRIFEADVDFRLPWTAYSVDVEPGKLDVESSCLHELGHALGLADVLDPTSIMYPALVAGDPRPKRSLSPNDIAHARQTTASLRTTRAGPP